VLDDDAKELPASQPVDACQARRAVHPNAISGRAAAPAAQPATAAGTTAMQTS
jgi:hypothetical protein